MKPSPRLVPLVGLALAASPAFGDNGFARAIDIATTRVVKLYGMGAGLEANYGSGTLVSPDGLVITVDSLLIDARTIRATLPDGRRVQAEVVHRDLDHRLALLRLKPAAAESESADPHASTEEPRNNLATEGTEDTEGTENSENPKKADRTEGRDTIVLTDLPFFDLSIEAALEPGDWVLSAGNAFKVADGSEPVSVAHGVFSGRTRLDARRRTKDYDYHGEVLAIDAMTSNPGAAGSALVNLRGELVGIVGREVESNLTHTYFNYAIPRDVLYEFFRGASRSAADAGTAHGAGEPPPPPAPIPTLEWGDLGVKLATAGYRRVLPFVERVRIGSPAFTAGLRRDDLILSVNGRSVPDIEDCERRLRMLDRDAAVDLVIRRGESIRTIRLETKGGP